MKIYFLSKIFTCDQQSNMETKS